MKVKEFLEFMTKTFKTTKIKTNDYDGDRKTWEFAFEEFKFIILGGTDGVETKVFNRIDNITEEYLEATLFRIAEIDFVSRKYSADIQSIELTIMKDISI